MSPVIQEQTRERVSGREGIVVLVFGRDARVCRYTYLFTRVFNGMFKTIQCTLYTVQCIDYYTYTREDQA